MEGLRFQGITQEGEQFAIWFLVNILQEDEWESMNRYYIGETGKYKIDIGISDRKHSSVIIALCEFSNNPLTKMFGVDFLKEVKHVQYRLRQMPEAGSRQRRIFARSYVLSVKPARLMAVGFGAFSDDAFAYARNKKIEIYDLAEIRKIYARRHSFTGAP